MNIDALKERIKRFSSSKPKDPDEEDIIRIRNNPQYASVLAKLEELYIKREQLVGNLEKIELDIEACLVLLSMNERKEEINRNINK